MTKDEAISKLNALSAEAPGDPEGDHCEADGLLLLFLSSNGFKDVADAWEKADARSGFWYA